VNNVDSNYLLTKFFNAGITNSGLQTLISNNFNIYSLIFLYFLSFLSNKSDNAGYIVLSSIHLISENISSYVAI